MRGQEISNPSHPAVRWGSTVADGSSTSAEVTCPICGESRVVEAKSVRYRIRRGGFTGLCARDRLIGKRRVDSRDRPEYPGVDWEDTEVVPEGASGRRRTLVRVHCPTCGDARLLHPAYLRLMIHAAMFRPECRRHRDSDNRERPEERIKASSSSVAAAV
jgi:predicted RNA-binding Zn-ribbon protein involved in translation (DUF1610 family)